jgi:hypothetical protein
MERWTVTAGGRMMREALTVASEDSWTDRDDVAALTYEGPFGPAYVAYHDDFRRTHVWGDAIPEGRLDDGPERIIERQAKDQRLRAGVRGYVGDVPLHVVHPRTRLFARRPVIARLGDERYRMAPYGWPLARVELRRPDDRLAVQSAIRLVRGNRMATDITPDEVTLHLLLYSTVASLRPRLP